MGLSSCCFTDRQLSTLARFGTLSLRFCYELFWDFTTAGSPSVKSMHACPATFPLLVAEFEHLSTVILLSLACFSIRAPSQTSFYKHLLVVPFEYLPHRHVTHLDSLTVNSLTLVHNINTHRKKVPFPLYKIVRQTKFKIKEKKIS